MEKYAKSLQQLDQLKEERIQVEEKALLMEQVATLSAVNQSESLMITPLLVKNLLEEAAKLRQQIRDLVSLHKLATTAYAQCPYTGKVYFRSSGACWEGV